MVFAHLIPKKEKISLDGTDYQMFLRKMVSNQVVLFFIQQILSKIKFAKQYISFQNKKLNKNENILIEFISIRILFKINFSIYKYFIKKLKIYFYLKKIFKEKNL